MDKRKEDDIKRKIEEAKKAARDAIDGYKKAAEYKYQ